jgi:circadian clock protein KaiC
MDSGKQDGAAQGDDSRCSTGIVGLDDILIGGLPRRHLFLIEGEPGTGKTTMGLQFLRAGVQEGERVMYVTLSESRSEIEGVARSHGWSLDGIDIFEYTPTEDSLRPEDQYSAFHPSEVEFQDTTQNILHQIEAVQPTRVVLDSLSELRLLARDSLRYRRQILALKDYFTNRNCTVLLLDDRTSDGHDRQLQSIAHGVVIMERVLREYGVERRRIRLIKLRGSRFREGYHDYNIVSGGVVVYPRLVAAEHRIEEVAGDVSSGIPELDAIWGGGLTRGTSTLILGPAGTGKSSLAMSYAIAATARGECAAAFLFDETRQSAIRRARKLGMDPGPALEKGLLSMNQIDPAELAPGEFIQRIRSLVDKKQAHVLIIDSLNGFMNAMPGEQFLAIQMHELLMFLNQRGVVTIMVLAQAGLIGKMESPVDLSYLADNVLLLRFFEARGQVKKALSVLKKRSGEHEDTVRELRMTNGTIVVGAPLTQFQGVLSGVPSYVGPVTRQHGTDESA